MSAATPRPVTPVGILGLTLEQLVEQVQHLTVPEPFKAELQRAAEITSGLEPYVESCSSPESAALAQLADRTRREDWSQHFADGTTVRQLEQEMLSGHAEGQFLQILVQALQAKRVLEIGMFTGYSALAMAEALPEDGEVVACEVDAYVAQVAQECFAVSPHGHKIKVVVAPAIDTLHRLAVAGDRFDFVFLDADKGGYVSYFKSLLDAKLLTPNSLICVDNTLMQGQPYLTGDRTANGQAIAAFNQVVTEDPRVQQVLLPLRDGITLIRVL